MAYPCILCGADLVATEITAPCSFCGQVAPMEYLCPHGHAVCEECQLATPPQVIERVCAGTHETDPVAIANLIMKHPAMIMHGPYHHQLIAPVMLTALANSGQRPLHAGELAVARKRTEDIPIAVCGSRGECGTASSVGALVAILTRSSYLKDRERSLALRATGQTLLAIADAGGPRCCKQSTYLALEVAADFLARELGLVVPVHVRCEFAAQNDECKRERCAYYTGGAPEKQ